MQATINYQESRIYNMKTCIYIYIHTHDGLNIYMKALIIFAKFRGAYKSSLILIFTYSSMYFQSAEAEIQKNTQNFCMYICADFLR